MSQQRKTNLDRQYAAIREGVGFGLVLITPVNLLLLYAVNLLLGVDTGYFTTQVIYYLSASSSLSVVGVVFVIDEAASRSAERQKRQQKRTEGAMCTVCGAFMRPGETKCGICGSAPFKSCVNCGTLMTLSTQVCPKCGQHS